MLVKLATYYQNETLTEIFALFVSLNWMHFGGVVHTRLGVASCFCYLFLFWNASLSPVLGHVAPVDWASPFKWLWQFQQQQPTSSGRKKALNHKNWGWRGGWELDWGKAACGRTSWEGCMCCPDSSLSDFTSSQWCSLLAIENHLFKKAVYNKPTPIGREDKVLSTPASWIDWVLDSAVHFRGLWIPFVVVTITGAYVEISSIS